ncbi:MAG: hypothetical protein OXC59_08620, partial [Acidimicrobiaceae bacterium]|nr:hypothetical protein [Acidimicrobiaceae bacterium]
TTIDGLPGEPLLLHPDDEGRIIDAAGHVITTIDGLPGEPLLLHPDDDGRIIAVADGAVLHVITTIEIDDINYVLTPEIDDVLLADVAADGDDACTPAEAAAAAAALMRWCHATAANTIIVARIIDAAGHVVRAISSRIGSPLMIDRRTLGGWCPDGMKPLLLHPYDAGRSIKLADGAVLHVITVADTIDDVLLEDVLIADVMIDDGTVDGTVDGDPIRGLLLDETVRRLDDAEPPTSDDVLHMLYKLTDDITTGRITSLLARQIAASA